MGKAWRSHQAQPGLDSISRTRLSPRVRGPAIPRRLVKGREAAAAAVSPRPPCPPRPGLAAAGGPGRASWSSQRIRAGAFWSTPVSLLGVASKNPGRRSGRDPCRCCSDVSFHLQAPQTSAAHAYETQSEGCFVKGKFIFRVRGLLTILAPLTFTFLDLSSCLDR